LYQRLLNGAPPIDLIDLARLQYISLPHASDWLMVMPTKKMDTFLTNDELRVLLCFRLGIAIYNDHICHAKGGYAFSCRRNNGKSIRHNMVNEIIHCGQTEAGISNTWEPSHLHHFQKENH